MEGVFVDEHAYTYGFLPATPGMEDKPCIGLIAQLDTIPDFSGENVKPALVENYDGGIIPLGESGRVLDPEQFPHLKKLIGHTIITTDGTTVLGADDKAGIAEIMTACERVIAERIPHGRIRRIGPLFPSVRTGDFPQRGKQERTTGRVFPTAERPSGSATSRRYCSLCKGDITGRERRLILYGERSKQIKSILSLLYMEDLQHESL